MPDKWNLVRSEHSPKVDRCKRCNLIYPEENGACHHCAGMCKAQALEYGKIFQKEVNKKVAPLGRIFIHLAIWSFFFYLFFLTR